MHVWASQRLCDVVLQGRWPSLECARSLLLWETLGALTQLCPRPCSNLSPLQARHLVPSEFLTHRAFETSSNSGSYPGRFLMQCFVEVGISVCA